jgi:hypothetical protein
MADFGGGLESRAIVNAEAGTGGEQITHRYVQGSI